MRRSWLDQGDGSVVSIVNRNQNGIRFYLAHHFSVPRKDVDLSTTCAGAQSLVDVPPIPRTEGYFIKKLFMVVAASLLGSTRRHRHRGLAMRLLFVLQWSSDHLTSWGRCKR